MLSRVAGNIYWAARYIERAENTARLINVNTNLLLDLPTVINASAWELLCIITGSDKTFREHHDKANEHNVIEFMLADANNPASILATLSNARENVRTTRDILPVDIWERLNDLYLFVKNEHSKGVAKRSRHDFLKQIITSTQQIAGIVEGAMNRDEAYKFLQMGHYLERADMTTRILDVRSANLLLNPKSITELNPSTLIAFEEIQWMSVLKSLSAYQMYRQRMRVRVNGADVLQFLLQDSEFPRSVLHLLVSLERCLFSLPRNDPPMRSLARLQRQVQTAKVVTLANKELHEFIDVLQIGLNAVHDSIAATYFGAA